MSGPLSSLRRSLRGSFAAAAAVLRRLLRPGPPPGPPLPPPAAIHPFDVTFGVDTSGLLQPEQLLSGHRNDAWSTAYYAIAPSIFEAALSRVGDAIAREWERFSFVDLGSGKGRAVLLAARFPFHGVLGVELHPELHRIAEQNLRRFRAPKPLAPQVRAASVAVRQADAAAIEYPPTPLVVYLYHPFFAPVLRRCLFQLRRSLRASPREVWVLYINAEEESVFADFPELHREWEETFTMTAEDQLADRTTSSSERVVAFHFSPPPGRAKA